MTVEEQNWNLRNMKMRGVRVWKSRLKGQQQGKQCSTNGTVQTRCKRKRRMGEPIQATESLIRICASIFKKWKTDACSMERCEPVTIVKSSRRCVSGFLANPRQKHDSFTRPTRLKKPCCESCSSFSFKVSRSWSRSWTEESVVWVCSSRLRVRVISFGLCDSESDVDGGDSALHLAVSFSQKCATLRQVNVSCFLAVQRPFHGTTAGRPNAPWRLAEPQLVELVPTYV